jgi:hypothetical protein
MITPGQLRGAVWSAIIHEARHILYFDHSNGSRCGSIANCPVVHEAVKQVDHRIAALSPVLNTRSYYNRTQRINGTSFHRYVFPDVDRNGRPRGGPSNGTNAMLKTYRGSAYIFADIGLEIAGTAPFDPDPGVCEEIDGTMACKAQGYNQTPGKKVFKLPRGCTGGESGSSASIARFRCAGARAPSPTASRRNTHITSTARLNRRDRHRRSDG